VEAFVAGAKVTAVEMVAQLAEAGVQATLDFRTAPVDADEPV
jgi:hypothetical protein